MNHAERIREAERAVVEAAVTQSHCLNYHGELECVHKMLHPAVDALLALRAATCPTCGGSGEAELTSKREFGNDSTELVPCPAGCDAGRRKEP